MNAATDTLKATNTAGPYTHDTVPTRSIQADGVRFAYRRFGNQSGKPIVFLQHYNGNMDNFDSAVSDALARDAEIVLFDNRGVGASTGRAPETIEDMARDAAIFIDALGLRSVDVLGHSMGGEVAQMLAVQRPDLVSHLVLVGTGPRGGEGMQQQKPATAELFAKTYERQDEMWLPIMFAPSSKSQQAGREWLARNRTRVDRDAPVSSETAAAYRKAAGAWGAASAASTESYAYLRHILCPTLIVNGSNDIVIETVNSYVMQQAMPNAKLVIYPDSNHGAHYEYHEDFVAQVRLLLGADA